jgi:uncharacterized protein YqjF (DUF2071 family)
MTRVISGAWHKIIMVNYAVDPSALRDLVPHGTRLSYFEGRCFVTLAGFLFSDIKVLGLRVPFHRHVPEANLRFYVESLDGYKKGLVFIKELVSKRVMAMMANRFYRQNYSVKNIKYSYTEDRKTATLKYSWGLLGGNRMKAKLARVPSTKVKTGSEADYILHNFLGYASRPDKSTLRYEVTHPAWTLCPVIDWKVKVNFEKSFGKRFEFLSKQKPHSIFVTEGSPIAIYSPSRLHVAQIERAA